MALAVHVHAYPCFACSWPGRSLAVVTRCTLCGASFCLEHIIAAAHGCPTLAIEEQPTIDLHRRCRDLLRQPAVFAWISLTLVNQQRIDCVGEVNHQQWQSTIERQVDMEDICFRYTLTAPLSRPLTSLWLPSLEMMIDCAPEEHLWYLERLLTCYVAQLSTAPAPRRPSGVGVFASLPYGARLRTLLAVGRVSAARREALLYGPPAMPQVESPASPTEGV